MPKDSYWSFNVFEVVITFILTVVQFSDTDMICQLKKLQSWPEELFIMPLSEMEPVVVLQAVYSPSFSSCVCVYVGSLLCDMMSLFLFKLAS